MKVHDFLVCSVWLPSERCPVVLLSNVIMNCVALTEEVRSVPANSWRWQLFLPRVRVCVHGTSASRPRRTCQVCVQVIFPSLSFYLFVIMDSDVAQLLVTILRKLLQPFVSRRTPFGHILAIIQGSHFLVNQGMSGNSVLSEMSLNFAVWQRIFTGGQMPFAFVTDNKHKDS